MTQWIAIGTLAFVAIVIPVSLVGVLRLLRSSIPEQGKSAVYESDEGPTENTRIRLQKHQFPIPIRKLSFFI